MSEAHFKILGFTAPSGQYMYHDDGYVRSISDATIRVNDFYGLNNSNYDRDTDKLVIGRTCKRGQNIHIFYLDQGSTRGNIRIKGHEETHALEDIGGLEYLTNALRQNQNVNLNLNEVDEKEVRAELGALYALHSRGLSPWGLVLDSLIDADFVKARRLYKQSKQPQKRFFIF